MSIDSMRAALQLIEQLVGPQDEVEPRESFDAITYTFRITSIRAVLEHARPLITEHGATFTLTIATPGGNVMLSSVASGDRWSRGDVKLTDVISSLVEREERAEWPAEWLLEAESEIDRLAANRARMLVPKEPWRAGVEAATGRRVWVGPRLDAFAEWLAATAWRGVVASLFGAPGSAILIEDWPGKATTFPPRLFFGKPSVDVPSAPAEGTLPERLADAGRADELPYWRAAQQTAQPPLPFALRRRLRGVAVTAAAWALADVRDGNVRPFEESDRTYELPAAMAPEVEDGVGAAVLELARWVAREYDETRLNVTQRIAAERVADPYDAAPADPVLVAVALAHKATVAKNVEAALDRQERFEHTFLDLDKAVAEIRAGISAGVDQVVLRALTGAIAIAIAALASTQVRGWPAAVGAGVIVVYLLANVRLLKRSVEPEAKARLADAETELAVTRARLDEELAKSLKEKLPEWRTAIEHRVAAATKILLFVAAVIFAAGMAGWLAADRPAEKPTKCECKVVP